eukprot:TRINITY_DN6566_c0_g1_i4.p1 TRINITY_DN6566_c0_g1~~TRINITY_DN6566_c0_g1_i4.p1  ORF type:complete len:779 (-),score=212.73 TRINITY_DN6566_c0_g1_i4:976-3312(-)
MAKGNAASKTEFSSLVQSTPTSYHAADVQPSPGEEEEDPWAAYYEEAQYLRTNPEQGLSAAEVEARRGLFGKNEFPDNRENQLVKLLMTFLEPMAIIVWIAVIIEAVQCGNNWPSSEARTNLADVLVLLALQFLNSFVGWYETLMAEEKIRELTQGIKKTAMVIREGTAAEIDEAELVPGDIIKLGTGCAIPADVRLLSDNDLGIKVDESMLTGESEPQKRAAVAEAPLSGCKQDRCISQTVLCSGNATAIVLRTGTKTNYWSIYALMTSPPDISHFEMVLNELMLVLVGIGSVVVTVVLIFLLAGPPKAAVGDTFGFCVVLLIASIPIALKVVCTATLAMGATELAKEEAIVQRLSSIEELAGLQILCTDKTGTLTLNKMSLQDDLSKHASEELLAAHPGREGFHRIFTDATDETGAAFNRESCLRMAVLGTEWTHPPEDAIDRMLLEHPTLDKGALSREYRVLRHVAFHPSTRLTHAHLEYQGKVRFRVAKGAVQQILDLCRGSTSLQHNGRAITHKHLEKIVNQAVDAFAAIGIRCLVVARSDHQAPLASTEKEHRKLSCVASNVPSWYVVGLLTFLDPARPDSAHVISKAREFGVVVKMITGDSQPIAREMCNTVGLDSEILTGKELTLYPPEVLQDKNKVQSCYFGDKYGELCDRSDGFAQVKPEHKYLIVESLRERGYLVGMCGDGVNDAPALKRAHVGIAVEGATKAAQASADIVLTAPGLSTIVTAMVESRKVFTRMQNFVIYRVACTEQVTSTSKLRRVGYDDAEICLL